MMTVRAGVRDLDVVVIKPPKGLVNFSLAEIWRYRELLVAFVVRNVKVRYKQSVIGLGWAIFQPLATMIIFTIFFGRLAKMPSDGIPYPVFVYAGLLFWNLFSQALNGVSNSLVESGGILKKVYFPRIIAPLAGAVTPAIDFLASFVVLLGLMAFYGFTPSLTGLLMVPVLMLFSWLAAIGPGLFLTAVNIKYRDVKHVLPFLVQMWMFLTPVIYPVSLIPEKFRWLIALNPMAGVIDTARAVLLGTGNVNWMALGISAAIMGLLLVLGIVRFQRAEKIFADVA
jgi:lipopolysaccharide transport system permease protein